MAANRAWFRWLLPLVLLGAGLGLYTLFVRPMAAANEALRRDLTEKSGALLSFLEKSHVYPNETIYQEMLRLEGDLRKELEGMMPPVGGEDPAASSLEEILQKWGYSTDSPLLDFLRDFERQIKERSGPGGETLAARVAHGLAQSLCSCGVTRIENLGCRLLDPAAGTDAASAPVKTFEITLRFQAGATEAAEFLDDWMLYAPGGYLIEPGQVTIERVNPTAWGKDLSSFSSPPLSVELRAKIDYL